MSGIIGSISNAVQDGANYVSDTLAGKSSEAAAETNKQAVKSDQTSLGQKANAAGDYLSNKTDQKKNEASAEANKQKFQHD